jgi:uncharacterized membrane protein YfcA
VKVAWRTMAGTGAFIVPFAVIYWFLSYEDAGTALLVAVSVALLFLGAYLWLTSRRLPPLPEDRTDGMLPEEDVVGVFPSGSLWPLVLGAGAMFAALGLAYSGWLALPGLGLVLLAIGGLLLE